MKLRLTRDICGATCTHGKLYVDGEFACFTLEDTVRAVKIPGETAIPAGVYDVEITMSNRFKRLLPILLDVPNFSGVRIHPGNTAEDTEGCILVGNNRTTDSVLNSRAAFNALFLRMQAAIEDGQAIKLEITQ